MENGKSLFAISYPLVRENFIDHGADNVSAIVVALNCGAEKSCTLSNLRIFRNSYMPC